MMEELREIAKTVRRIILDQAKRANVGHIGSALSVVDILVALYMKILNIPNPRHQDRDRFILSKGHAGLALYAVLYMKKWIRAEQINTYCFDGGILGVHPEHVLSGVDFTTGSLGHGLTMGAGAAMGAILSKSKRRVFVLMSDAEMNEGSVWEAAMFASHHNLSNLVAIIDNNGQQAMGYTKDILFLGSLAEKWKAFGWDVHEVNGHDMEEMVETITGLNTSGPRPHVIIAKTTFGKGVSYMEGQIEWHYLPMSDEEYQIACKEVG